MKKIILLLLFIGFSGYAQVQIITAQTPAQLVQNVLTGQGVTPFNIKFNGTAANANMLKDQVSYFNTNLNPTNLGFPAQSAGVLLSTGRGVFALGPNTSHNNLGTGQLLSASPNGTDPDLALLSGNAISSSAVLEFDFVATGLTLNFDFIFGSEEYAGYVNSINDSFGFFLSGGSITGIYSGGSAKNIALVPNTNTEVSINTINNGPNNNGTCNACAYYYNNGPTGNSPNLSSIETVEYDGFTTVLRATSELECGVTYHIKLAIGNVSDNLLDSGVFLKNFRIEPLELLDNTLLAENTSVCAGETVTINSGLTQIPGLSFGWTHSTTAVPPVITTLPNTTPSIEVTESGLYALTVQTATNCVVAFDNILIGFLPPIPVIDAVSTNLCTLLPPPYIFNIDQTAYIFGAGDPSGYAITYYSSSAQDALDGVSTGIIPDGSLGAYTLTGSGATIWIRIEDLQYACVVVKPFTISASPSPSGTVLYPNSPYCAGISTLQPPVTTVTLGGVYSALPVGLTIDPNTGAVNPSLSTPGSYVVNYNLVASGNCPAFAAPPSNVRIDPVPAGPSVSTPIAYCQNATASPLSATGSNLLWYSVASGGTGVVTAPTPNTATSGTTIYYVSQTTAGCESARSAITVDVLALPSAPVTAPVNYCQTATAIPLTAAGSNLLWYTAVTGGTGNAATPTPSTAIPGITTYYVSQTVSGCESLRSALTVTINATPALAIASSPVTYCQNAIPTSLTATGTNLLWYTALTGGTGAATAPMPITTSAGNTAYYVSQTINGCEGPRATIVVTVAAIPTSPLVTTPITYCQNATASSLTATASNLLWYTTATGGTGVVTAPTPNTATSGTTIYYVSQTTAGCESARSAITVDVLALPSAPVTAPVNYCQTATASPLTAAGSNLLWYTAATGGTGNAATPTPSTAIPGITTYYVSQTVSGCESLRSALTVTINATPALAIASSPVTYCQNAIATSLTATGTNLLWYTSPTGGTGAATAPMPITTSAGNTTYYVSQTINGCEGPRAAIVVTVTITPDAPVAVVPAPYCQYASASPLNASGSNLLWYIDPLNGVGSATAPTPNTSSAGTKAYYVSQTVNGCESPRAIILVSVLAAPAAPITAPINYCQNASAVPLNATGTNLLWYTSATGGTGNATTPTPNTTTAGSITYYVSQTVSGCESLRSALNVTTNATPSLPLVSSTVNYCQNAVASPLTATGTNLMWYTAATGGTGNAAAPTPITTSAGNTTYYVSQKINGCEGPRATVLVTINSTPSAPIAATPVVYCQNVAATPLVAAGASQLWYTAPTSGTGSVTAPTPNTTISGTTVYYVSQTVAGCESARSAITVNVISTPSAPLISNVNYCQGVTAMTLLATGTSLLWYTLPMGGTGNATAPTPSTATAGITTYYVSQTVNGCEGPRAALNVTVYSTPALPAVNSLVTYCQNAPATPLIATGTSLLWYSAAFGGIGNASAPTPITALGGNTTYYVSQTINGCEGPRASILVTVGLTPLAPLVTSPMAYCQSVTANPLTASGSNLLWYTAATGGTGNAAAPTPSTSTIGTTSYYVSQTTNGCESPRAMIAVVVNEVPDPTLQNGTICIDENNNVVNSFLLDSGLVTGVYSFEWYNVIGALYTPISGANSNTYSANAAGTYGVKATNIATGCVSGVVTATVTVSPSPNAIAINVAEYFADDQRITVNVTPPGNYLYQLDNGALQSSNIFVDVPAGTHEVFVKSECGDYKKEVYLMDFPRYFTPNGDGYNDTWNIFSLSGQAKAKIYIFDRLGKLLKEISPSGLGWDGKFNHQNLPSTDYWFIVHYQENSVDKVFKSHFALKR